jgi:hypothetical protein
VLSDAASGSAESSHAATPLPASRVTTEDVVLAQRSTCSLFWLQHTLSGESGSTLTPKQVMLAAVAGPPSPELPWTPVPTKKLSHSVLPDDSDSQLVAPGVTVPDGVGDGDGVPLGEPVFDGVAASWPTYVMR